MRVRLRVAGTEQFLLRMRLQGIWGDQPIRTAMTCLDMGVGRGMLGWKQRRQDQWPVSKHITARCHCTSRLSTHHASYVISRNGAKRLAMA